MVQDLVDSWVRESYHVIFDQKLHDHQQCMDRRVVWIQKPKFVAPHFGTFTPHTIPQPFQNTTTSTVIIAMDLYLLSALTSP